MHEAARVFGQIGQLQDRRLLAFLDKSVTTLKYCPNMRVSGRRLCFDIFFLSPLSGTQRRKKTQVERAKTAINVPFLQFRFQLFLWHSSTETHT